MKPPCHHDAHDGFMACHMFDEIGECGKKKGPSEYFKYFVAAQGVLNRCWVKFKKKVAVIGKNKC